MTEPFNKLTPAESERLALLIEGCAEVQQAATKILRHGYASRHPDGGPSNRVSLEVEAGDLLGALDLMLGVDLNRNSVEAAKLAKLVKVKRYMHHQAPDGEPT